MLLLFQQFDVIRHKSLDSSPRKLTVDEEKTKYKFQKRKGEVMENGISGTGNTGKDYFIPNQQNSGKKKTV